MPVSHELPPLALEVLRTLRQTYDHRGPNAFDEDAGKVFQVLGSIIAQVCGRERLAEAMETLEASLQMEGIGEAKQSAVRSTH
jgi:predicted ArsR family transcriptional regulator